MNKKLEKKSEVGIPIAIEISKCDSKLFDELESKFPEAITVAKVERFIGSDIIQAIIILSSVTVHSIAKILIEQIRSKKHFTIKAEGIEIKGISEKNVFSVLEKILHKVNTSK